MVCQHLRELEMAIAAVGIRETFRGKAWSSNCREWIYYDCLLDLELIGKQFQLAACVVQHANHDPKSGREAGLICNQCNDAIMGAHPKDAAGKARFPIDNR